MAPPAHNPTHAMLDSMTPERWQQINAVLDAVLELSPEERAAYLRVHYPADEALCAKVLDLAAAYQTAASFLEEPVAGYVAPLMPEENHASMTDRRVGPYRLLQPLARGGMGTVYLAARADEHFEKKVAVKLIRRGLDTDDVVRRFLGERQILARLEHPGIARLLDGGVTDDDRPYLVMEYIEGLPIDRYCDTRHLSVDARLALFLQVCDAVRYAHQNLVIHRDLKSSNILISKQGTVKLLDFGIAKLLSDEAEAGLTKPGARVMTPEYAAPEQVKDEPVTTTTDVYALGVLLYKLLTGRFPYRLHGRSTREVEHAILNAEPPQPSTAITAIRKEEDSATPEAVSQARDTSVSALRRRLSGDLDTICLKALQKDPARRYASVEAFEDDVRRYLGGLPVHARPDTLTYRTTKFVRRHRAGVAATALFLALLTSYAVTTRVQARRIAVERDKAEQVAGFLADVLKRADPFETADDVTVRQVLDRAAARIEQDLTDQPEVQAQLRYLMSGIYQNLGQYDDALPHARQALTLRRAVLGDEHPDVAASLNDLADVVCFLGDYDAADSLYREALTRRRTLFGHESEPVAESLADWGVLLFYKGEREESLVQLREVLALNRRLYGDQDPRVAESLHLLAAITRASGNLDAAEPLLRESLAIRRAVLPPDHPDLAPSLNGLAAAWRLQGRYDEAEPLLQEALALYRRRLGPDHPYVAQSLTGLAYLRQDQGRYYEADSLIEQALVLRQRRLGPDHPETRRTERDMAAIQEARIHK